MPVIRQNDASIRVGDPSTFHHLFNSKSVLVSLRQLYWPILGTRGLTSGAFHLNILSYKVARANGLFYWNTLAYIEKEIPKNVSTSMSSMTNMIIRKSTESKHLREWSDDIVVLTDFFTQLPYVDVLLFQQYSLLRYTSLEVLYFCV